jgi:ribose transport system permease protein
MSMTPSTHEPVALPDASVPAGEGEAPRGRRDTSHSIHARLSGMYIIALFIAIFAVWVPSTFLTTTTVQSILGSEAITAIIAIGLLFSLAAGQFDLSAGGMVGLSTVIVAWLTAQHGYSPESAIAIALAVGVAVGALNGLLVVGLGVHSFIATLGMSSVLIAITEKITGEEFITGVPSGITDIANPQPLGIPVLALYALVVAVVAWYVLEHTPAGRRLHAVGAGPEAARLAGVPTRKLAFASLIATSTIAALAGVFLAAEVGSASPDQGSAYLLPAFAAALLGSTQILPGRVNVAGTMVAIVLLAVGIKGLQLAGGAGWVTDMFNGVALMVAVSAANFAQVTRARRLLKQRRMRDRGSGPPPEKLRRDNP